LLIIRIECFFEFEVYTIFSANLKKLQVVDTVGVCSDLRGWEGELATADKKKTYIWLLATTTETAEAATCKQPSYKATILLKKTHAVLVQTLFRPLDSRRRKPSIRRNAHGRRWNEKTGWLYIAIVIPSLQLSTSRIAEAIYSSRRWAETRAPERMKHHCSCSVQTPHGHGKQAKSN